MGNIDLLDPLARVRPAIVVSSHPSSIHNSFPSSAQLHHTNPSSHGKHKMGDKSEKAMEKQGSRTRNVYAKEEEKKNWTRREGIRKRITGEIGKLGNGTREDKRKKRK